MNFADRFSWLERKRRLSLLARARGPQSGIQNPVYAPAQPDVLQTRLP